MHLLYQENAPKAMAALMHSHFVLTVPENPEPRKVQSMPPKSAATAMNLNLLAHLFIGLYPAKKKIIQRNSTPTITIRLII